MSDKSDNRIKPGPVPVSPRVRTPPAWMTPKQAAAFNELRALENRVKVLLGSEKVHTIEYPQYHTFAKQVAKAQRKNPDWERLEPALARLIDAAKARLCQEPILRRILKEIFNLEPRA